MNRHDAQNEQFMNELNAELRALDAQLAEALAAEAAPEALRQRIVEATAESITARHPLDQPLREALVVEAPAALGERVAAAAGAERETEISPSPAVIGRIGFAALGRLAVAAGLALAVGLGAYFAYDGSTPIDTDGGGASGGATASITDAEIESLVATLDEADEPDALDLGIDALAEEFDEVAAEEPFDPMDASLAAAAERLDTELELLEAEYETF